MARIGYLSGQFRAGAAEAYGIVITSSPTFDAELDAWLAARDPEAFAADAGHSHSHAALGHAVVVGMQLVEKAQAALGRGPMDGLILSSLNAEEPSERETKELRFIEQQWGPHHPALRVRYSLKLADVLTTLIGPKVLLTKWWKGPAGKAFRQAEAKNRTVKQVMED